jgi:hypothetical protein
VFGGTAQAAVVTAAGSFDLSSFQISSTGGVTGISPVFYSAYAEGPLSNGSANDAVSVSVVVDDTFSTGAAIAVADAADIDPFSLTAQAVAFDGGSAFSIAGYEVAYEIIDDGEVEITVDYSALYDLDGSDTADTIVALTADDSLSGAFDEFSLLPGDPTFAFGTLTLAFSAFAGDAGSVFLSATAVADTGLSTVPTPGVLLLFGAGLVGVVATRARATAA